MPDPFDLSHLDSSSFEHLVNALAMRELGSGHTGFGPGPDAGRDGFFEGTAPYPSTTDQWSGVWYIQSKFHKPHLSTDAQKWLQAQIDLEIGEFTASKGRTWPDNWIVATNVELSASAQTGTFDVLRKKVASSNASLSNRFHVWGGRKILDLLTKHPDIRDEYGHFLTPGHIIAELIEHFRDDQPSYDDIVRTLVVVPFQNEIHTKLEQAGSDADNRPGIHRLFRDLPFYYDSLDNHRGFPFEGKVLSCLASAASRNHRNTLEVDDKRLLKWQRHPKRSATWFVQGGPGQGKSTLGQYFAQIHRAAIILDKNGPRVTTVIRDLATEVKQAAEAQAVWPLVPRIPLSVELRDYSHWLATKSKNSAQGLLTYLAYHLSYRHERAISPNSIEKALSKGSWFLICDGLDEVPGDTKDLVATEIQNFVQEVAFRQKCDLQTLCTSRPQGYSGQFEKLDASHVRLRQLQPHEAFECAKPVLGIGRSEDESKRAEKILASALESQAVAELMRTPLQSHIMAVVVRDGNKPPERRWQLFNNFYDVIRRREANKDLGDTNIAKLLRENEKLLRSIHNRLGFVLHAEAESASGATTSLPRERFRVLAQQVATQMIERDVEQMVSTLMEATTHRLVLVNTPENGELLRFDVRQLQEFFAAEFLYESVSASTLGKRLEVIAGDSHWREVLHFLLSALIENGRQTELSVAIDVLSRLDNADLIPDRVLNRRLARGALSASRLIEEGVLEQDRRTRQSIRPCLTAVCALTQFDPEHNLSKVSQPNSREWIINYLLEQIIESAPSERVGAAALLMVMLPGSHSRWNEFESFFNNSSSAYKDACFECLQSLVNETTRLHGPATALILRRITDNEWQSLTNQSFSICLSLLSPMRDDIGEILTSLGKSPLAAKLAIRLIPNNDLSADNLRLQSESYGVVAAHYSEDDWAGPHSDSLTESTDVPGVLKIPYYIIKFAGSKSRLDFANALECLKSTPEPLLSALPTQLRSLFPAFEGSVIPDDVIHATNVMTDEEFASALKDASIAGFSLRRWAVRFSLNTAGNAEEFVRFASIRPSVATIAWFGHLRQDSDFEPDASREIEREIGRRLRDEPHFCFQFPHLWGAILQSIPNALELRDIIAVSAKTIAPRGPKGHVHSFSAFKLNLPNEAPLLPHLLASLSQLSLASRFERKRRNEEMSELVSTLASAESLATISADCRFPFIERGASVVLHSFLSDDGFSSMVASHNSLVSRLAQDHTWFANALAVALAIRADPTNEQHCRFFGMVLESARENFSVRSQLDSALSAWRERPLASLRRAGTFQSWLAGTD